MPNVVRAHKHNDRMSRSREFVDWMLAALRYDHVSIMRIHISGDFYSSSYVSKWYEIVQRAPRVQFFGYTRSWRMDDMLPGLISLGQLPNMSLWWSVDRHTGPAPYVANIKIAYMAIDDADAETVPADYDLVFRDRPRTVLKKTNGVMVCPVENKITPHMTCSQCKFCYASDRKPRHGAGEVPNGNRMLYSAVVDRRVRGTGRRMRKGRGTDRSADRRPTRRVTS